jgi:hypothetical protein
MRASARGTSTVARHLPDQRSQEEEAQKLVALEELATTLEDVLVRVNQLREQERTAAAA